MNATIGIFIKVLFLLTPFFVLSRFISLTRGTTTEERHRLALRATRACLVICLIVYLFGRQIFSCLGITLDAFRIGSGIILLLTGIEVVRNSGGCTGLRQCDEDGDIAVVPLAIPYTVGPGTVGTLLVMGAGTADTATRVTEIVGIVVAVLLLGGMLYFSASLEKILKKKGLNILSKLTGLFLAALASQIVFEGIRNILRS